jgi:hypothetical protein
MCLPLPDNFLFQPPHPKQRGLLGDTTHGTNLSCLWIPLFLGLGITGPVPLGWNSLFLCSASFLSLISLPRAVPGTEQQLDMFLDGCYQV